MDALPVAGAPAPDGAGPVPAGELGGREEENAGGAYCLVESRPPGALPWPRVDPDRLLHELELLRGVGPVTAARLRQDGAGSLTQLLGHPRWKAEAAACLEQVARRDVDSLRRRGASDAHLLGCFAARDAALLDIETTGLWFGQPLFLVGVLAGEGEGLCLRQYLARDFREESAVVQAVLRELSQYPLLLTFNGRKFDVPYIRARAAAHGIQSRLEPAQVDLLYAARRRYRGVLPDCRLQTLERCLLDYLREDDVPGRQIPEIYHRFVRTRDPGLLQGVLQHNARDLVNLARLLPHLLPLEPGPGEVQAPFQAGAGETVPGPNATWGRRPGARGESDYERGPDPGDKPRVHFHQGGPVSGRQPPVGDQPG